MEELIPIEQIDSKKSKNTKKIIIGVIISITILAAACAGIYKFVQYKRYAGIRAVNQAEEEFLSRGISMPYYNQKDPKWGNDPYGKSTIAKSGCGITCCCMAIDALVPDAGLLPPEAAKWSYEHGHYVENIGTSWSLFPEIGKEYGLKVKTLTRERPEEILEELKAGHPVIMSVDGGKISYGPHIILLRGVSENGKIYMSDSYYKENSLKEWDFQEILDESSSLAPECFWSFSKE